MAVSYFDPAARTGRHRGKTRATVVAPAFGRPVGSPSSLTVRRPAHVGRPTAGTASGLRAASLVEQALATAFDSLDSLEERAIRVAREFRWRRGAEARRGLVLLTDGLQSLVMLAASVAEALDSDLEAVADVHGIRATDETRRAVLDLIDGQMSADEREIARVVEQGVVPVLARWRDVFELLGRELGGFDPEGCAA